MSAPAPAPASGHDARIERLIGGLLRAGVIVAAVIGGVGAALFLFAHGGDRADWHVFRGEPAELRSVRGIVTTALTGRPDAIMQLGILALIATPIARVILSLVAFARQRDRTYVGITLIVLAVLAYSLLVGRA